MRSAVSYQLRVGFLSLAIALVTGACGGDSTGPSDGGAANVVIVTATSSSIRVQNNGGAGEFYVEAWDHQYVNPPSGTPNPVIRLGHTDPSTIAAGAARTIGNPGGTSFRVLAFTRDVGTTSFFQSSCYGSC